ncbi:MAG: CAP domain-containing protein [Chloroflexales bacterium]|nr:CAP domain-containing protein [Chloroflexales bacterium]
MPPRLPPLTIADGLARAAKRHGRDMAANHFLGHTGPDGSDPGQRISEAGYQWGAGEPVGAVWAENVAAGYADPAAVVQGWMESAGHRENMLSCALREVGGAVARRAGSTYGTYWTAVFSIGQG